MLHGRFEAQVLGRSRISSTASGVSFNLTLHTEHLYSHCYLPGPVRLQRSKARSCPPARGSEGTGQLLQSTNGGNRGGSEAQEQRRPLLGGGSGTAKLDLEEKGEPLCRGGEAGVGGWGAIKSRAAQGSGEDATTETHRSILSTWSNTSLNRTRGTSSSSS